MKSQWSWIRPIIMSRTGLVPIDCQMQPVAPRHHRTLVRSEVLIVKIKKSLIGFNYSLDHKAKIPPHVGRTGKSHHCFVAHNYLSLQTVNSLAVIPRYRGLPAGRQDLCVIV